MNRSGFSINTRTKLLGPSEAYTSMISFPRSEEPECQCYCLLLYSFSSSPALIFLISLFLPHAVLLLSSVCPLPASLPQPNDCKASHYYSPHGCISHYVEKTRSLFVNFKSSSASSQSIRRTPRHIPATVAACYTSLPLAANGSFK